MNVNIRAEDVKEFPDHYIYAMAQNMPIEKVAAKFYNAKVEDIQAIVQRHAERMAVFNRIKGIVDKDMDMEDSNDWS